MVKTKPTQSKHNKIILFLMAIIFAIFFIANPLNTIVKAESSRITSVIEDLQTDPNFKIENYPSITPTKPEDYKLQVIQIAESTGKELFIYVYQPTALTQELRAISINISTSIGDNFAPKNYDLTFLNSRGVFQKYVVDDFYVKNDALRYYDIISIFRAWNEDLDNKPGADQSISERSYKVGQLWKACTVNNEVSYTYDIEDTIEIIDKFVGFVRYLSDSNFWNDKYCDRHFVAFSTDKKIDELVEAEVGYRTQRVFLTHRHIGVQPDPRYYEIEDVDSKLIIDDESTINATIRVNAFNRREFSYSWKNIQSVEEFLPTVNTENMFTGALFNTTVTTKITDDSNLKNKEWVLTFDNTTYTYDEVPNETYEDYTIVSDVTILRLKFITNGEPYNLGVVDNKQMGSGSPINTTTVTNEWGWLMKLIIKILKYIVYAVIVFAVIFCMKLVWDLIKSIFKRSKK